MHQPHFNRVILSTVFPVHVAIMALSLTLTLTLTLCLAGAGASIALKALLQFLQHLQF
jgi:hypothetical protein